MSVVATESKTNKPEEWRTTAKLLKLLKLTNYIDQELQITSPIRVLKQRLDANSGPEAGSFASKCICHLFLLLGSPESEALAVKKDKCH